MIIIIVTIKYVERVDMNYTIDIYNYKRLENE